MINSLEKYRGLHKHRGYDWHPEDIIHIRKIRITKKTKPFGLKVK